MPRAPRITGRELIKKLNKHGFIVIRTKGSHFFLEHSDGRHTTVPVHSGEIIGPGLLRRILRDTEIDPEELG